MNGITKVIDELGTIILVKEIEIASKQKEIDELKKKVEAIEQYLSFYEECYKRDKDIKK